MMDTVSLDSYNVAVTVTDVTSWTAVKVTGSPGKTGATSVTGLSVTRSTVQNGSPRPGVSPSSVVSPSVFASTAMKSWAGRLSTIRAVTR